MKKIIYILIIYLISLTAQENQKYQTIGDLELINGEILENCILGYRTFGKINKDSSNVIVMPTWFGGTTEYSSKLIGPDKLIDSTKYYLILIDALSNGVSTSSSNYKYKGRYPEINIKDMVNSQYILLKKHFKLKNIFAMIGGSMGGMQILEWVVSYPDFIKKAIPYVPSPRRSTYDQLTMNFTKVLIEELKTNKISDEVLFKLLNYIDEIFARSPEFIIEKISYERLDDYLLEIGDKKRLSTFTIDNYYSQLIAMINHNIYANFNNSINETIKKIKTKILFIVASKDILVHPSSTIELAKALNAEILLLENNAGHLSVGSELKKCSEKIVKFLDAN